MIDGISEYYLFYEDSNRNGLKYNIKIDNVILDILKKENEIIRSGELRSRVGESIGHKISPDTFHSHLSVLVNHKILNRWDKGRGKEVLYSLTKYAKKMLELNLLGVEWKRINIFRKIYEKIFLQEVLHDPLLIVRSEQEFNAILSDLGANRENIEWGRISTAENDDSVRLVYKGNYTNPRFKFLHKKHVKKYWQERKGQTSVSEKIEFISFPRKPHDLDTTIIRKEYWEINKNSPNQRQRTEYAITMPGVSIEEFTNENSHQDFQFERSDIEKTFELLKKAGLIGRAFWFRGHMRYKVIDDSLRDLISTLRYFYVEEFSLLSYKWKHFEWPTIEEKKRWKWIMGEKDATRFFNEVEIIRYENRKRLRQCKNVLEYHRLLNSICPREYSSPVYGTWPYDGILYDYIKEREDSKKQQKTMDRKMRTRHYHETKKEVRENISKYEQYLRKRLDFQLEHLPINLENEGIEHLKMWYRRTIDEYPFLKDIIKEICPKAFEPDNQELQSAIIHQLRSREIGAQILARDLKAIDFENAYDRKNEKKIPYEEYEKRDPATGKIIKHRILNLTSKYGVPNH
jgi:hypothetical protein